MPHFSRPSKFSKAAQAADVQQVCARKPLGPQREPALIFKRDAHSERPVNSRQDQYNQPKWKYLRGHVYVIATGVLVLICLGCLRITCLEALQ